VIKKEVFAPSLAIDFDKKSDRTGHTPNSWFYDVQKSVTSMGVF